jgi:hypothetical protein
MLMTTSRQSLRASRTWQAQSEIFDLETSSLIHFANLLPPQLIGVRSEPAINVHVPCPIRSGRVRPALCTTEARMKLPPSATERARSSPISRHQVKTRINKTPLRKKSKRYNEH